MEFPGGSAGKESTCNAGGLGSIPGLGRFPWRRKRLPTPVFWPGEFQTVRGFPGSSDVKESTYNVGDPSLIPGLGSTPGEAYGNPLQYSCLENPNGQRSLKGCSPWGSKESDMTE